MSGEPELSLAIPLYNEEENAAQVAMGLVQAFDACQLPCELVLVNNGSRDGTGRVSEELASQRAGLRAVQLSENQGYGGGILAGLRLCTGRFVGYTWGDAQVSAEDHVRVFQKLKDEPLDLCKAVRVERQDGLKRRLITVAYNRTFPVFFRVGSGDVNGCPKIFRKEALDRLALASRDWFIDAEAMIKSRQAGYRIGEVPVVFRARSRGASNVRWGTVLEFACNMVRYRLRGSF